jgi:hypothetical protein
MAAMWGMRRLDGYETPQSVAAQAAHSKAAEWKGITQGEARRVGAAASSTRWDLDHDRPMPPPMARVGAPRRPVGIAADGSWHWYFHEVLNGFSMHVSNMVLTRPKFTINTTTSSSKNKPACSGARSSFEGCRNI